MKINGFAYAVKNKPNQTQPVVSLSNLFQYKKSGFKSKLLIFDHLALLHLCTYHLRAYVNFSVFSRQKRICPIKSHFLLPPTTPFFKISLKNFYFHLFSDFFSLFSTCFSCLLSSVFSILPFTLLILAHIFNRSKQVDEKL